MIELLIKNDTGLYAPPIKENIEWSTEREGVPGKLEFTIISQGVAFEEGNHVRLKVNNKEVFYGFIFSRKPKLDGLVQITAYDQLRYLKNKDSYIFENTTATEIISQVASDFKLQTGVLEDTGFKIVSQVDNNSMLFDMIQTALDSTLSARKEIYVLYDDFGKLTLRNIGNMKVGVLIDVDTAKAYDYTISIEGETYNQIKLVKDNDKTGVKEVFISKHTENMNKWGMLQYYEEMQTSDNGQVQADAFLSLYNKKTRKLDILDAFGSIDVRAGCMLPVKLNLGDVSINNYMIVESCKHKFGESTHFMDLKLRGGEFVV
jgi:Phage late control gene D protein (GPD).